MAVYVLLLWLGLRAVESRQAPAGLVVIETHRSRGTIPPLLDEVESAG